MREKKVLIQMWLDPYINELIERKSKNTFRSKVQYIKDLVLRDVNVGEAKNELHR